MERKNRVSAEPIISIYLFVTLIYRQTEVKRFISDGMMGVKISKIFFLKAALKREIINNCSDVLSWPESKALIPEI